MLDGERAESVLIYLEKYEYAALPHVSIALVWSTDALAREQVSLLTAWLNSNQLLLLERK